MDAAVELPVAMPGLRAMRGTSTAPHTGVKEFHGIGRIERGDTEWWGHGKRWHSSPGTILVKQPGDVVRHVAHNGPTTYTVVVLPAREVARVVAPITIAQLEPGDDRAAPFHRLLDAAARGADRLALEVAVAEAIDALAVVGGARPEPTRPVRRALEYLRANLAGAIALDDLAAHAGLDKFHLCRAFRAQIGMPPHAYLIHLRIARAKALLARGVRASDVAPLVGLYDQPQLTRHFRRIVGTTPARYSSASRAARATR